MTGSDVERPRKGTLWFIATGRRQDHGCLVAGPYVDREEALAKRVGFEEREQRDDLWVVDGDDVPVEWRRGRGPR